MERPLDLFSNGNLVLSGPAVQSALHVESRARRKGTARRRGAQEEQFTQGDNGQGDRGNATPGPEDCSLAFYPRGKGEPGTGFEPGSEQAVSGEGRLSSGAGKALGRRRFPGAVETGGRAPLKRLRGWTWAVTAGWTEGTEADGSAGALDRRKQPLKTNEGPAPAPVTAPGNWVLGPGRLRPPSR